MRTYYYPEPPDRRDPFRAPTVRSANHYCPVCERTDHNARTIPTGMRSPAAVVVDGVTLECHARVIRIAPECGSLVRGSDPGTR